MTNSKAFRYTFSSPNAAAAFYKQVKKNPDIKSVQYPQQNMVYDYNTVLVTPHSSCLFSLQQKIDLDKLYEQYQQVEKKRQELLEESRSHREARDFDSARQCIYDSIHIFENV